MNPSRRRSWRFSVGLSMWMAGTSTVFATPIDLVVPAYFYPSPNSPWQKLVDVANQVAVTAIMNPGNGPGNAKNADYSNAVTRLRQAGGKVIGYVYTQYGARPLANVLQDIDRYYDWYPVDGIFVDEMSNTGAVGVVNYYRSIYDHVKQRAATAASLGEVMGNPGTNTVEVFLSRPLADRLVVSEDAASAYPQYSPAAWYTKYHPSQFVHLIHTQSPPVAWPELLRSTATRGARGIYVTDDVMPNPWDVLPTYWGDEVKAVQAMNPLLRVDLNNDLSIDAADAGLMFEQWGNKGSADFTQDGIVDAADAALLFEQWTSDTPPQQIVPEPARQQGLPAMVWIIFAGVRRMVQLRQHRYRFRQQSGHLPPTRDHHIAL